MDRLIASLKLYREFLIKIGEDYAQVDDWLDAIETQRSPIPRGLVNYIKLQADLCYDADVEYMYELRGMITW